MTLRDALYNFLVSHPGQAISMVVGFFAVIQYFFGGIAQSLPAPTATSKPFYIFCFTFMNWLAANWHRASIPKIEDSPNFEAGVEKYLVKRATAASTVPATVIAVNAIQKDQTLPKGDIQA